MVFKKEWIPAGGVTMAIAVLGSLNIDFFFDTDHIVCDGETLKTQKQTVQAGGKGLNQAIACSRAGQKTVMGGKIGSDGKMLVDLLETSGADCRLVETEPDVLSGKAIIQRTPDSRNAILLYPGANSAIDAVYLDFFFEQTKEIPCLLLQNEISSLDIILKKARESDKKVFFNPAPMSPDIFNADLDGISCLILNQTESMQLASKDMKAGEHRFETEILQVLIERWVRSHPFSSILVTIGDKGALYQDYSRRLYMPPYPVEAVDSTGAGDTFTGYFTAAVSEGLETDLALQYASAAAALSVSRFGAAVSVPNRTEVEELIEKHPEIKTSPFFFRHPLRSLWGNL